MNFKAYKHLNRVGTYKKKRSKGVKSLTVCIAAICEDGIIENSQKIIMCADRQISTGINNYESGVSKIIPLTNYCYAMISSNDSARTNMVLYKVMNSIVNKELKIEEIVKLISKEFEDLFMIERERNVLSKFGLTYSKFSEKSKEMNPILLKEISDSLINFETSGSMIIIVGLDPRPHIYTIDEKGEYSFEDESGFAVVGGGSYLAFPEMTRHEPPYNPRLVSLTDALIRVFRAKIVAQRVGGVGPTTDLAVLHLIDSKVALWEVNELEEDSQKTLIILHNTIEEIKSQEEKVLEKSIKELSEIFKKEVEKIKKEDEPREETKSSTEE